MNALNILKQRGFISQMTHEKEIEEIFKSGKVVFYNGYDPTADSLHIGHYLTFMAMAHLQRQGHMPIVLMGGGTGMVGDPDKADTMRPLMEISEIDQNVANFKKQAAKFIDLSPDKAIMVDNADWLRNLNYINFVREYGVHFSVNRMLAADKYKIKFEGKGLNFFELNYMIMQAYDFLELSRKYGCILQTGGSDQWSNIIAGVELIRRIDNKSAYGITFNLLARSDGAKMGKTLGGAIWLDAKKTSPYEFYQYFRNIPDEDVKKCFNLLTFLSMDEIENICNVDDQKINIAKERLAYEITNIVHGEVCAKEAQDTAKALFSGGVAEGVPSSKITKVQLGDGLNIIAVLKHCELIPSSAEGRRLVLQGGITFAGQKIVDINYMVQYSDFLNGFVIIQKGKKVFHKLEIV